MSDPHPWRESSPRAAIARNAPPPARLFVSRLASRMVAAIGLGRRHLHALTDSFSSEHTATVLSFFVRCSFLISPKTNFVSFITFILARAPTSPNIFMFLHLDLPRRARRRKGWRRTWGIAALSVAAGYSIINEIHQAFVVSRTASPYDSLLDSTGAFSLSLSYGLGSVAAAQNSLPWKYMPPNPIPRHLQLITSTLATVPLAFRCASNTPWNTDSLAIPA